MNNQKAAPDGSVLEDSTIDIDPNPEREKEDKPRENANDVNKIQNKANDATRNTNHRPINSRDNDYLNQYDNNINDNQNEANRNENNPIDSISNLERQHGLDKFSVKILLSFLFVLILYFFLYFQMKMINKTIANGHNIKWKNK